MSVTYPMTGLLRLLCGKRRPRTAAVILAGGNGTRMRSEGGVAKQYLLLCGIPVIVRSMLAFENCPYIDEIVAVCGKGEESAVSALAASYGIKKLACVVTGGATRQDSARHGLEAVSSKMKYIAVHDAARCLVTPDMIADVVSAAYANRAASAGCPATDTLKKVNENGYITGTVDRSSVFAAQTPQVFDIRLYRAATYTAQKNKTVVTDDNMLMEAIGQTVKMVDTGKENMKLTTPEDLVIAEAIIENRNKKPGR